MEHQTLGPLILDARRSRGLTRRELAQMLRITPGELSEWERDVSSPSFLQRRRLSRTLGIPVGTLDALTPAAGKKGLFFERTLDWILNLLPPLAGIGVLILALLKKADLYTGLAMLSVGLVCLGINLWRRKG